MREIATDMKLQVEFKETTLANFPAALEAREFDFSLGPMDRKPSKKPESEDSERPDINPGK